MPFQCCVQLFLASESENMPKQKLFFIQTLPKSPILFQNGIIQL